MSEKTKLQTLQERRNGIASFIETKAKDFNQVSSMKEKLSGELMNLNGRIQMLDELILEEQKANKENKPKEEKPEEDKKDENKKEVNKK